MAQQTSLILALYNKFNMSELQLIAITYKEFQRYKMQDEAIAKLNLQITGLTDQIRQLLRVNSKNKQLVQENAQLKGKVKLLSLQTIRLARAMMEKEQSCQKLTQIMGKIIQDKEQVVNYCQQLKTTITQQRANVIQSLEVKLKEINQRYFLLENQLTQSQKKVLQKQKQLQEKVQAIKQFQIEVKRLQNMLQIQVQEKALLIQNIAKVNAEKSQLVILLKQTLAKYQAQQQKSQKLRQHNNLLKNDLMQKISSMQHKYYELKSIIEKYTEMKSKLQQQYKTLEEKSLTKAVQQRSVNLQLQKQIEAFKKLEEEYKTLKHNYQYSQSYQGQIFIYEMQAQKIEKKLKFKEIQVEELIQNNKNLVNEIQAWKIMISEQYCSRWKDLLQSKYFQSQLRTKKNVFAYCRDLLFKHLCALKLQLMSTLDLEEEEGKIILTMQIKNMVNEFEKQFSVQNLRQLL